MMDVGVIRDGRWILHGVEWNVDSGEHWVVIGPNGAGKSTLVAIASGRLFPSRGEVWILGLQLGAVHLDDITPFVGFVSGKDAQLIPDDEPVIDVVLTAAYGIRGRWKESYDPRDVDRAHALLELWNMGDLAGRRFGSLSDGERKRALIARARMSDPEVLILDEPAAGLDVAARENLVSDLEAIARDPGSPCTITVTHHTEEIPTTASHAAVLSEGRMIVQGPIADVLTDATMSSAYGIPLRVGRVRGRWMVTRA